MVLNYASKFSDNEVKYKALLNLFLSKKGNFIFQDPITILSNIGI